MRSDSIMLVLPRSGITILINKSKVVETWPALGAAQCLNGRELSEVSTAKSNA